MIWYSGPSAPRPVYIPSISKCPIISSLLKFAPALHRWGGFAPCWFFSKYDEILGAFGPSSCEIAIFKFPFCRNMMCICIPWYPFCIPWYPVVSSLYLYRVYLFCIPCIHILYPMYPSCILCIHSLSCVSSVSSVPRVFNLYLVYPVYPVYPVCIPYI